MRAWSRTSILGLLVVSAAIALPSVSGAQPPAAGAQANVSKLFLQQADGRQGVVAISLHASITLSHDSTDERVDTAHGTVYL
jgi:hypothetical protein